MLNVFAAALLLFAVSSQNNFQKQFSLARAALESTFIHASGKNCAFVHSTANSCEHKSVSEIVSKTSKEIIFP